jgi:CDP-diglyceride synthetase
MAHGWRQNSWVIPISAVMLAVIVTSVPPFLRFDPARQPADLNSRLPGLDFALAEAHVLLATVALVTLCLNIWPWLRLRHVQVHRWSGRVYVFSALSASLLTLPFVSLNNTWQADIGASAIGGFWFLTTLLGYIAIRRRNEVRHRRWMLYSFAMATSVVWGLILPPFLSTPAEFPYMVELVRWVGPLLNLGAVKWWLDRTAHHKAAVIPFPAESQHDHIHRRAA